MEIRRQHLKSFNAWVIYQINTLEHSMLSFFSSWRVKTRFERIFIYLPYSVITTDRQVYYLVNNPYIEGVECDLLIAIQTLIFQP